MQTTLRLPDDLYAEVKRRAAEEGLTITAFLEGALRMRLAQRTAREAQGRYVIEPIDLGGLTPEATELDMNDNSAVLDFLDDG